MQAEINKNRDEQLERKTQRQRPAPTRFWKTDQSHSTPHIFFKKMKDKQKNESCCATEERAGEGDT